MPLALDDPAWETLPDAYDQLTTGQRIAGLITEWNEDEAGDLFWSCLCHQDTLYPATFAAIPHLVALGGGAVGKIRRDIAAFLGYVVLVAQQPSGDCCGIPATPWAEKSEMWDRQGLGNILPEFLGLFPKIAELEQIAFLEEAGDSAYHHAAGYLAANRFDDLASFLLNNENGGFECGACGRLHEWIRFEDRIAYYDDVNQNDHGGTFIVEEDSLRDWNDGAPSRAAGFARPWGGSDEARDCLQALLEKRADSITMALAKNWRARIGCATCDWTGELRS